MAFPKWPSLQSLFRECGYVACACCFLQHCIYWLQLVRHTAGAVKNNNSTRQGMGGRHDAQACMRMLIEALKLGLKKKIRCAAFLIGSPVILQLCWELAGRGRKEQKECRKHLSTYAVSWFFSFLLLISCRHPSMRGSLHVAPFVL